MSGARDRMCSATGPRRGTSTWIGKCVLLLQDIHANPLFVRVRCDCVFVDLRLFPRGHISQGAKTRHLRGNDNESTDCVAMGGGVDFDKWAKILECRRLGC